MGIVLLLLGITGVLLLANQILLFISAPQDVALVNKFMQFASQTNTVALADGRIEVPEILSFALGGILYIGVLSVGASITHSLISSGTNLLGNQIQTLLDGIRNELLKSRGDEKPQ